MTAAAFRRQRRRRQVVDVVDATVFGIVRRPAEEERIVQDGDASQAIVLRKKIGIVRSRVSGASPVLDENPLVVLVREQEHLLIRQRGSLLLRVQDVLVATVVGHFGGTIVFVIRRLVAVLLGLLELRSFVVVAQGDALRRSPAVDLAVVLLLVAVEEADLPPLATREQIRLFRRGSRRGGSCGLHSVGHGEDDEIEVEDEAVG